MSLITDFLQLKKTPETLKDIHDQQVANAQLNIPFAFVLILAATIATLGLAANSEATIVGAMLVSPLMKPIMSLAYGISIGDWSLNLRSVRTLLTGIAITLVTSAVVENLLSLYEPTEMILARTSPSLIDLCVAIAAAGAGTLAVTRKSISDTLPGVAIAVSLVPPLCVTGIGVSVTSSTIALGSLMLFSVNLVAIVLMATCLFILEGVGKPRRALPALGIIVLAVAGFAYVLSGSQEKLRQQDIAHEVIESYLRESYVRNRVAHPGDLNRVLVEDYDDHIYVFAEVKGAPEKLTKAEVEELHRRLSQRLDHDINLKILLVHSNELTIYTKKLPKGIETDYGVDIILPK
jgi:uncharacterized hydrophobic protein (TIGR00271 family)